MATNGDFQAMVTYIERERGVDRELVLSSIEQAIQQAARRNPGVTNDLRVTIDRKTHRRGFGDRLHIRRARPPHQA